MNTLQFFEIPTGYVFQPRGGGRVDFSLKQGITAILDSKRTADNFVCIGRDMMLNLAIQTAFLAMKLNMGVVQFLTYQNKKDDIIREMSAIYSYSQDEEIRNQRQVVFQKEFIDSGNLIVLENGESQDEIRYQDIKIAAMFVDGIDILELEALLSKIIEFRSYTGLDLVPGLICPQMSCPEDDEKFHQTMKTLIEQTTAVLDICHDEDIRNFINIVDQETEDLNEEGKSKKEQIYQAFLQNLNEGNRFLCNLLKLNKDKIEASVLLEYDSFTGRVIPNATELHLLLNTPKGFVHREFFRNEGGFWEDISLPD